MADCWPFGLLWQNFRPSLRICNVLPHPFGGKHMSYHGDHYIDIVYSFSTYHSCRAALEAMSFLEKVKSSSNSASYVYRSGHSGLERSLIPAALRRQAALHPWATALQGLLAAIPFSVQA